MSRLQTVLKRIKIKSILFVILILITASLPFIASSQFSDKRVLLSSTANAYEQQGGGSVCTNCPPGSLDLGEDGSGCGTTPGAGCDIGGTHGVLTLGDDGNIHWTPDYGGSGGSRIIGGGGGGTNPTAAPPPVGTGALIVSGMVSDATHLQTCAQLAQVKACLDAPATEGCDAISTKSYLANATFYLDALWGPNIQASGAASIIFTPIWENYNHNVTAYDPSGTYSPYLFCHNTTAAPAWIEGSSINVPANITGTMLVGFGPIMPWFKVSGGGNVFGNSVSSPIPVMYNPLLLFDGTSAAAYFPGVASSITGVDFSDSPATYGLGNISRTNWNTDNATTPKNWYSFFSQRLVQATKTVYTLPGTKPPMESGSSYTVYTVAGDLTVNSNWTIAASDKLIIEVSGNMTINAPITITDNGFVAFVVKGDISVSSSLGTTYDNTTPLIEGIYVSDGTFHTGDSTTAGKERFVGKGIFIASAISLERDFTSIGHNKDAAADYFIYNPTLFMIMPDILKDLTYVWQEVAP